MTEKLTELITISDPRSPISEAYRTLRTNLDFASLDQALKTLVVTSAGVGEGKSTTLANLAVVSAQAGRKVILVDADLRRPTLHQVFGLENETGLTTAIMDEAALASPAAAGHGRRGPVGADQRPPAAQSGGPAGLAAHDPGHRGPGREAPTRSFSTRRPLWP